MYKASSIQDIWTGDIMKSWDLESVQLRKTTFWNHTVSEYHQAETFHSFLLLWKIMGRVWKCNILVQLVGAKLAYLKNLVLCTCVCLSFVNTTPILSLLFKSKLHILSFMISKSAVANLSDLRDHQVCRPLVGDRRPLFWITCKLSSEKYVIGEPVGIALKHPSKQDPGVLFWLLLLFVGWFVSLIRTAFFYCLLIFNTVWVTVFLFQIWPETVRLSPFVMGQTYLESECNLYLLPLPPRPVLFLLLVGFCFPYY